MEKPWKVIFAFLGVFIAGAVFGGFFSLGIGRRIWEMEAPAAAKPAPLAAALPQQPAPQPAVKVAQPPLPVPQEVQRAQLMRRVVMNQLNLTAAQKAEVTPIIQHAVQDIWRQQQNFYRETTFITQRMKQDIAKELTLTPEQQGRLDELWLKQLDLFRKRQAEAQAQRQAEAKGSAQQRPVNASLTPPADKPAPVDNAKPSAPNAATPPAPAAEKPPGGGN